MNWKDEAIELHRANGSVRETAKILHKRYDDVRKLVKENRYKKHMEFATVCEPKVSIRNEKNLNRTVGVIGDTHFPFVAKGYLEFLVDTFNKFGVDEIVHIGDMSDFHAVSRHQTEDCAMDANREFQKALECTRKYAKEFPKMKYALGNHSVIPFRQAATLGIPRNFLKSVSELWEFPKEWEVDERFIIDNVLYEHGTGYSGKTAALDKATNAMMSCVIGHSHAFGGCLYKSNSEKLIFGLNAGCGIDIDAYAFYYGRYSKNRETLGCGIVFDSANAIFVPMAEKYFHRR